MKHYYTYGVVLALSLVAVQTSAALVESAELPRPETVIETLRSGDFTTRERLLGSLAEDLSTAPIYVPVLRAALRDKDRAVRQQAAMALAAFGESDQRVLDELLAGLCQRHPDRYHSRPEDPLSAMAALVTLRERAVPHLVKAISDESFAGWLLALEALGEVGPAAKAALPVIETALTKCEAKHLVTLIEVKWRIDRDAEFALNQLLPLLNDERNFACHGVLRTLVRMGPDAKQAMPALVAALKLHKHANVLWAVGELAPHVKELAMPALLEALQEPALADDAAVALRDNRAAAEDVVPSQIRRLRACKPGDNSDPKRIIYTIVIYEPVSRLYVLELIQLLNHQNPDVRRAVVWGLCRVGGEEQIVEAALAEALKDPDVSEEASQSLKMRREAQR